ncbi:hypothetical protein THRCLA_10396, partial [Thraustotheca clavata]
MKLLVHVGHLLLVVLIVFAIAGVHLFDGVLHQQCNGDLSKLRCGGGRNCPMNSTCSRLSGENELNLDSNYGFTSFDNIFLAMLTVFQIISLSDWGSTMFALIEAKSAIVVLYFILLIPLGSYFVTNFVIAIVHDAYSRKLREIQQAMVQKQLKLKKKSLSPKKRQTSSIIEFVKQKPSTLSHMEIQLLMTRFMVKDGQINYQNFIKLFSQKSGIHDTMCSLRLFLQRAKVAGLHSHSIFRFMDSDRNGQLNLQELEQGFKDIEERIGVHFDRATVAALHEYLDVDNSGEIDVNEFIAFADVPSQEMSILEQKIMLELHLCEQRGKSVQQLFKQYDQNHRGI